MNKPSRALQTFRKEYLQFVEHEQPLSLSLTAIENLTGRPYLPHNETEIQDLDDEESITGPETDAEEQA